MQNEPAFFKELLPIPNILSGIRAHFWESPSPESLKQAYGGALPVEELREVRRGLLEIVGVFLKAAATQANALSSDDVQVGSFLNALLHACSQHGIKGCDAHNTSAGCIMPMQM